MKYYFRSFAALALLVFATGLAQEKKVQADKAYNNYAFMEAISSYEELIKNGYSENEAFQNLGDANYYNARYAEAAKWYGQLLEKEDPQTDYNIMYRYAQSLKSIGEYKASDEWMDRFAEQQRNDQRALLFDENRDYLKKISSRKGTFAIKNLSINSSESDFAPSLYKDQLVFSSARDTGMVRQVVHRWNDKAFLDLYTTPKDQINDPVDILPLDKRINTKAHESSIVFTKDGNTAYFTRNNDSRGLLTKDDEGISRLKLYKATFVDGKWKNIEELPFNNDSYSVSHPALSPNGKRLYFASDMPGTHGASDLFYVDILADGSYSTPVNLGNKINTPSRETFPFIDGNEILYFASDGHPGLGGLDLFATQLHGPYVVNLAEPLNGPEDDFSLVFDSEKKEGFFASNRPNGKGSDDIYSFTMERPLDLECLKIVDGTVRDQETKEPIPGAKLVLTPENGAKMEILANENGEFSIELPCRAGTLVALGSHELYIDATKEFTLKGTDATENIALELTKENVAPTGTDLAQLLQIEPIYFDFDKWNIRASEVAKLNKIISYMEQYPNIKIEIGSHTDSRGSRAYNEQLSEKRAQSTMQFFISRGVATERLSARGYGESQLVNGCSDNVACSRDQHQQNRRSEFRVVE